MLAITQPERLCLDALCAHSSAWHVLRRDLNAAGNCALTGMIVITSGCATLEPWASALGGVVGGLIILPASLFVSHVLKIDDPVDAFAVWCLPIAEVSLYHLQASIYYSLCSRAPTHRLKASCASVLSAEGSDSLCATLCRCTALVALPESSGMR